MTAPIRQRVPLPVSVDRAPWADGPVMSPADVAMHDDVAVVRMRGELGASVLHAYLGDIWWRARAGSVVDLAELAFIDCACLGVLVRCCKQIRRQGGSFALAGPQPAVRMVLAATGLLTWFEVHDTVREAVADAGTQRSPVFPAACQAQPRPGHDHILGRAPAWRRRPLPGRAIRPGDPVY